MTSSREENKRLEESIKERELTWQTIRRDLTTKREDAIREAWNVKRTWLYVDVIILQLISCLSDLVSCTFVKIFLFQVKTKN